MGGVNELTRKKFNESERIFGLILSIILAVSITEIFKRFSEYDAGTLMNWIILSVIIYSLSVILLYDLISHKAGDKISFFLKIITLYILVFFPFYLNKLNGSSVYWYILIGSVFFTIWGAYDSHKKENKFWGTKFWIGLVIIIGMILLLMGVL